MISAWKGHGVSARRLSGVFGRREGHRDGEWVLASTAPASNTATEGLVGAWPMPSVTFTVDGAALRIMRSGFGGRPAYARVSDDVCLASTDLAWVVDASRMLGMATTLDADALARCAIFDAGRANDARTLVREIQEIPPASRAWIRERAVTIEPIPAPAPVSSRGTPGHHSEELLEYLSRAVDRAARGRTVGVLTGGGLDSAALLSLAKRCADDVRAFALDFPGPGDDRPHLAALERTLGAHSVRLSPEDVEPLPDFTACGLPMTWPSGAAEAALLGRAREWGADRVLSGFGGDEAFDASRDAAARLLAHDPRRAVAAARSYAIGLLPIVRLLVRPLFRDMIPLGVRRQWRRRARPRVPPWAGPRLSRVIAESRSVEHTGSRLEAHWRSRHLARASVLRAQEESLSGVLRVDPYLDEELLTFVLALPEEELLGTGERRGLFRDALTNVLPDSVRTRRDKASFEYVHQSFFRPPHLRTLATHRDVTCLADLGIVEPKAFRSAFDRACAPNADDAYPTTIPHVALHAMIAVEAFTRAWPGT